MYTQIMTPVDLAHLDQLDKALETTADLALHYKIPVCYVGVTAPAPSQIAHTPNEFAEKLKAFANAQAQAHGHEVTAKAYTSHDPASDLDDTLLKAVDDIGADLVVMSTHTPTIADYVWPSNGGKVASHARTSVLLVR
jgi:nucleotide-binding universal stress UspA family protein